MGNILRRGVDAYRQNMSPKPAGAPLPEPPRQPVAGPAALPVKPDGLFKTAKAPGPRVSGQGGVRQAAAGDRAESRCRRVAKFLILIGANQAAEILGALESGQVEEIAREIASIRGIGAEEAEAIFAEFRSLFSLPWAYSGASSGGVEAARRILYAALGPEKGETLLNKMVPGSRENVFGFLEELSPDQIGFLLKEESPATAALILSRLTPKLCAGTVEKFPPERGGEILRRIARQGEVAPEVLDRVAAAVKEKARRTGGGAKEIGINGIQTLAAILKQGDYAFGDRIISELEADTPSIGKDLKDKLYTLDDVLQAADRPLREKLKTMSNREIAILLKGRNPEFGEKILSNVSAGRRELIREESEILGAVPRRDCDDAARNFLGWFRLAREEGNMVLAGDDDVFV
jgi:flagellar motor switch protein FliG